jgi:hypothetical protein
LLPSVGTCSADLATLDNQSSSAALLDSSEFLSTSRRDLRAVLLFTTLLTATLSIICVPKMPSGTLYAGYAPLDHGQRAIRLLDIEPGRVYSDLRCRIRHANLSDHPHYAAVSHTWGRRCLANEIFYMNGRRCRIRLKLQLMLQSLSNRVAVTTLWVDSFST